MENKTYKVIGQIFMKHEVSDYMDAFDMSDKGQKAFGAFSDITYSTTTKVTTKYYKDMIKNLVNQKKICYACLGGKYFGFKPNLQSLSDGKKFVFIPDLRNILIQNGLKEVEV